MSAIGYLSIVADENGCSHFERKTIAMDARNYAPPAPSLNTSAPQAAGKALFLELPAGWFGGWHPTPVRQWLILMSGSCEFETGDGERAVCKAGDAVLLEDTTGRGHQTKVIGGSAVRMAAVQIA